MLFALNRLRWPIAFIGAVAIAALLAFAAFSSSATASHQWRGYHWAREDKVDLKLVDNVSTTSYGADWDKHLKIAAGADTYATDGNNDWNSPAQRNDGYAFTDKLDLSIAEQTDPDYNPNVCPLTEGVVQVCNAEYGLNGWIGLAQIWTKAGDHNHITKGAVKMNDSYLKLDAPGAFDFNTSLNTEAWRNFTMCQEVGHTFGLLHTDENFYNTNLGSCMDYTRTPSGGNTYWAPLNEYPGGVANLGGLFAGVYGNILPYHDYDQLEQKYQHSDNSTTTIVQNTAKVAPAASERAFNRLEELGERIYSSPDGLAEIYRRPFGDGSELISRVIRAE